MLKPHVNISTYYTLKGLFVQPGQVRAQAVQNPPYTTLPLNIVISTFV